MDEKREEVIGIDVFGSHAKAYINDYTIEINLPSWSGRIHSRINARAELARLKQFITDVENEINDRDAREKSERAQVVEDAIAEDGVWGNSGIENFDLGTDGDAEGRAMMAALASWSSDDKQQRTRSLSLPLSIDDQRRLILLVQLQQQAIIRSHGRVNWLEQQLAACANRGRHDLTPKARNLLAHEGA